MKKLLSALALLAFSAMVFANTIAEDALGEGGDSPSTEGVALLVSAFFVFCGLLGIKENHKDWKGIGLMFAIAGAAWINTTVTALIVIGLVFLIPVLMIFGGRR